jgi:hypothetical protein
MSRTTSDRGRLSRGAWDVTGSVEPESHHRGFLIIDGLMTRRGAISRREDRTWLLHGSPPGELHHHRLAAAMT